MLNSRRKKTRIFRDLINLTDEVISVYDDNGNIVTIEPCILRCEDLDINRDIGIIIQDPLYINLLGFPTDNAVIVTSTGIGRDKTLISKLSHFSDNFDVILSPNYF